MKSNDSCENDQKILDELVQKNRELEKQLKLEQDKEMKKEKDLMNQIQKLQEEKRKIMLSFNLKKNEIVKKMKQNSAYIIKLQKKIAKEQSLRLKTKTKKVKADDDDYTQYYAGNPIIDPIKTNLFTADPSAHVWEEGGRLYLYASHDQFPSRGCDLMDKYHVFSTSNMVEWKDEGEILSSDDVSWGRPEGGFMWAPDCALVNGTYYFYFPHPTGAGELWNSTWRIGVATSDQPASGFKCADDGFVKTKNGEPYVTDIDPCIFLDDDGTYYLYTGGGAKCQVAKMSEDMMTLAEDPVSLSGLEDFHEGMWVFKKDGIYYAMYADNTSGNNCMRYATSESPYGPWNFKKIILTATGCDTTHGSIVQYKGHWYLFYHNCEVSGNGTLRNVCVDELFFEEDGSIREVEQTKKGVQAVDKVEGKGGEEGGTSYDPSMFPKKTDYSFKDAKLGGSATYADDCIQNLHLEGAYAEWGNIDGGKGGKAMVTVYYGTPDGGTSLVNTSGDPNGGMTGTGYFLKFNKTTDWADYSGESICYVDFNEGTDNTIRFTCGMGGVNITGISVSLPDDAKLKRKAGKKSNITVNEANTHYGVKCQGCNAFPIKGCRYKCIFCDGINYCEKCEKTLGVQHGHPLLKINNSQMLALMGKKK